MTLPFRGQIALRCIEVTGAACRAANYSSEQMLKESSKLELNIITFIDVNHCAAQFAAQCSGVEAAFYLRVNLSGGK
jgi:hypothetical protein